MTEQEGYTICREEGHFGSRWSDRLQALICPHPHDDGKTHYAKEYDRWQGRR